MYMYAMYIPCMTSAHIMNDVGVNWFPFSSFAVGKCSEERSVWKGILKIKSRHFGSSAKVACEDGYELKKAKDDEYQCRMGYVGSKTKFYWVGTALCVKESKLSIFFMLNFYKYIYIQF